MGELYFVRHGQASFGEKDYGRLSSTGIRQAKLLAQHMIRTGQFFDAVYCGTLLRQRNTAKELIGSFPERGIDIPELSISGDFDEFDSLAVWTAQIPMMLGENPALSTDIERVYNDKKTFQRIFEQVMYRCPGISINPGFRHGLILKNALESGICKIMETHGSGRGLILSNTPLFQKPSAARLWAILFSDARLRMREISRS